MVIDEQKNNKKEENRNSNNFESSVSSASEQISDINEFDATDEMYVIDASKENTSNVTETTFCKETNVVVNPFHNEMKEYFK